MERTVKQRLMEFAEFRNLSISKFESLCGLGNGYVGKLKSEPGSRKLEDILKTFPELNRAWLLFGEGEMLKESNTTATQTNINGNNNYVIGNSNIVGNSSAASLSARDIAECSYPTEVECPKCGETIEVVGATVLPMIPKEITKKPDVNLEKWRRMHPRQMRKIDFSQIWGTEPFVVQVDTRAMEPEYREGTFLVLQALPDITYATADGIAYVIDTMKPHTLFRNLTDKYDGTYILTANSDKRSSIRIKAEDIITIYDIVGSFRIGR